MHNLAMGELRARLRVRRRREADRSTSPRRRPSMGIVRADGRVATRNYIGILSSVNCSATVARAIADHFSRDTNPKALARLSRTSTAWSRSRTAPAAAWTPTARACRSCAARWRLCARMPNFAARAGGRPGLRGEPDQRAGSAHAGLQRRRRAAARSTSRTPAARARRSRTASRSIKEMLPAGQRGRSASRCRAAHITVGLQCGGSDGYSGISANPALGAAVDLLVRARRHRDPVRDARDLRRRAPADAPRGRAARSARS